MSNDYRKNDYAWIKELADYPRTLDERLNFFEDTSQISVPDDVIDRVVFQDRAKRAIRKIAQNKGHILMVGRPGTGKSMLANMFREVLQKSLGDYLKPKDAVVAYPGKDRNHIRVAYESPEKMERLLAKLNRAIESARESVEEFNLSDQIQSARKVKIALFAVLYLKPSSFKKKGTSKPSNSTKNRLATSIEISYLRSNSRIRSPKTPWAFLINPTFSHSFFGIVSIFQR